MIQRRASRDLADRILGLALALSLTLPALAGCDEARKQECDSLLAAMAPLEQGTPSAETVDAVSKQVVGLALHDQPLGVYSKNYRATLDVLSRTLKLKAGGQAPDGTEDVINQNLREARTDRADVARYCSK